MRAFAAQDHQMLFPLSFGEAPSHRMASGSSTRRRCAAKPWTASPPSALAPIPPWWCRPARSGTGGWGTGGTGEMEWWIDLSPQAGSLMWRNTCGNHAFFQKQCLWYVHVQSNYVRFLRFTIRFSWQERNSVNNIQRKSPTSHWVCSVDQWDRMLRLDAWPCLAFCEERYFLTRTCTVQDPCATEDCGGKPWSRPIVPWWWRRPVVFLGLEAKAQKIYMEQVGIPEDNKNCLSRVCPVPASFCLGLFPNPVWPGKQNGNRVTLWRRFQGEHQTPQKPVSLIQLTIFQKASKSF